MKFKNKYNLNSLLIHSWDKFQNTLSQHNGLVLLALLMGAISVRLIILNLNYEIISPGDSLSYLKLGSDFAAGKGFIDPKTNLPYAYWPPGWPMIIAIIYKFFGVHTLPLRLYQAFVSALLCPGVYLLGRSIFNAGTGLLAAIFCIVYPAFLHPQMGFVNLLSDPTYQLLLVAGLLLFFRGEKIKQSYYFCGLVFGFNALVKPNGLAVPGILILIILYQHRFKKNFFKASSLLMLGFLTAILPWTVRNYLVLNKLVLVSTNSGVNLYVGNANTFTNKLRQGDTFYDKIRAQGDGYEQGQLLNRQGIKFLKDNLIHRQSIFLRKMKYHFDPFLAYKIKKGETLVTISKYNWMYAFLAPFIIFGFLIRSRDKFVLMSALFLSVNILTALVYLGSVRYRLEIDPLLIIVGCMGLTAFVRSSSLRLKFVLFWLLINAVGGIFFPTILPKLLMDLVPGTDPM